MNGEAKSIADFIERIANDILSALADVPDDLLNQPLPLDATNTLFALATHVVGMGEFWVLTLAGGWPSDRQRAQEFYATGTGQQLVDRFQLWIKNTHQILDDLPSQRLQEIVLPPQEYASSGGFANDSVLSVRDCLLHVVEHSATHLGHIQLTVQFLTTDTLLY